MVNYSIGGREARKNFLVGEPWDVVDDQHGYERASVADGSPVPAVLKRRVDWTPQAGESGLLSWTGTLQFKEAEGSATFSGGRVRSSQVVQVHDGRRAKAAVPRFVTETYRFEDLSAD